MEFGVHAHAPSQPKTGDAQAPEGSADAPMQDDPAAAEDELQSAMDGMSMSEMAALEADLPQAGIGRLVGIGAADIQHAATEFAQKNEALLTTGEMAQVHRIRVQRDEMERQLRRERKQLQFEEQRALQASEALRAAKGASVAQKQSLAEQLGRKEAFDSESKQLKQQAAGASQQDMQVLQALTVQNEQLRQKQTDFKRECTQQLQQLRADCAIHGEGSSDDKSRKIAEIGELFATESAKANQMRRLLGQKGREIASLQRKIDDTPTRAELMQYERRFRELYQQVANKLEETKKYYSLFNTLEEKKVYLTKEVSLIDSIHENFNKPNAQKDKLLESMEGLVKNVQQNLKKAEQRLAGEMDAKRALQQKHDRMVERQRKYFKLVKDFQAEGQRSEQLAS